MDLKKPEGCQVDISSNLVFVNGGYNGTDRYKAEISMICTNRAGSVTKSIEAGLFPPVMKTEIDDAGLVKTVEEILGSMCMGVSR